MSEKKKGFTLIELLIIIAIIAVIAVIVLIAVDPVKRIAEANDARRWSDVKTIASAVNKYSLDNGVPGCDGSHDEIPADNMWRWIGTGAKTYVGYVDPGCPPKGAGTCTFNHGQGTCCQTLNDLDNIDGGFDFRTAGPGGALCTPGDLVCADINMAFEIGGNWQDADTAIFSVGGSSGNFVTGPDNYLKIYTSTAARHNGVWDDTAYRNTYSDTAKPVISVKTNYFKLEGLQIQVDGSSTNNDYFNSGIYLCNDVTACLNEDDEREPKGFEISHNIFKGLGQNYSKGISSADDVTDVKIYNNIFYDFNGTSAYAVKCNEAACAIVNNTIYNSNIGVGYGSKTMITNNIIAGCTNSYDLPNWYYGAWFNATDSSDYPNCVACGPEQTNLTNITLSNVFINMAADNFLLRDDPSNDVRGAGLDLYEGSEPWLIMDDIQQEARDSGLNDIGADQIRPETNWGVISEDYCNIGPYVTSTPGYLAELPQDPTEGDLSGVGNTGYMIKRDENGGLWVWAPHKSEYEDKVIFVAE